MIRIFASWQDRVILSADDEHHLVNVLRVLPGEKIELLIAGKVFLGVVQKTKPLQIEKLDHIDASHELPIRITLIYPVVKGEKMDWVVQKATELGVDELIPCSSERSPFCKLSGNVRPIAIASPTLCICVPRTPLVPGSFSNAQRGILVTT